MNLLYVDIHCLFVCLFVSLLNHFWLIHFFSPTPASPTSASGDLSSTHYMYQHMMQWWVTYRIHHWLFPMAHGGVTFVYSTVYSGTDERIHQSSVSLDFGRGIHWWPVNSPHKGPVTRKMFPFDDAITGNAFHISVPLRGKPPITSGSPHKSLHVLYWLTLN